MNPKVTTSLQRWLYVHGDYIPDVIRKLADEIEKFETQDDEYKICGTEDEVMYSTIEISYDADSEEYSAGICIGLKKRES